MGDRNTVSDLAFSTLLFLGGEYAEWAESWNAFCQFTDAEDRRHLRADLTFKRLHEAVMRAETAHGKLAAIKEALRYAEQFTGSPE